MHKIRESATLEKKGQKWRVLVISAGQGSSGFYSPELLQEQASTAWPKGTHIYNDHLTETELYERGGVHSMESMVGVTESEPSWDDTEQGMYADVKIFSKAKDFIEEAYEYIGLSVEANGKVNDEGIVEQIAPSPLNAIAVVPRAGRGGKFKELQEKYVAPAIVSVDENEGETVTEEQIQSLVEGIVAGIKPAFDELKESLKPEVEEEVVEEVDFAEVTESAIEADLPKTARARVIKSVREGAKVEEAIASEKALMEEYKAIAETEADGLGRIHESAKAESMDSIFGKDK